MSWVILALTLGASITSIIHGVFMLFGSLSVNTGALFDISAKILACLPVISAIFALIGGIIAFNRSKWGALFLFVAAGLCVPSKDTWLYGGIYFFAMLLCFFLKPERHDEYDDLLYEDEEENEAENFESGRQTPDYYFGNESENFAEEKESVDYLQGGLPDLPQPELKAVDPLLDVDLTAPMINNEPPKLRRRMSKTCPTCGATVAREARFCSACGSPLLVPAENLIEETHDNEPQLNVNVIKETTPGKLASDFADRLEKSMSESENNNNFADDNNINSNANDGDDMANKVFVKPRREYQDLQDTGGRNRPGNNIDAAASSYQEFSRYTKRNKKRKRSAGRKLLSMLLLVGAVGGALYFLLGLRKLPPGDLPPMQRNAVVDATRNANNNLPASLTTTSNQNSQPEIAVQDNQEIAVPGQSVTENILPNFTPEREPKAGIVVGSNVNVRSDHTTSSSRVARLNVNSKLEIIGTFNVTSGQHQGIWYNIITGGKEGWIYGRYVQPTGSGLPAGYSNALLKTFGSNKSQLLESLGNPNRNSSTTLEWTGLTATLKGEDITKIRVISANRELQNGLKVGMSQTALLQIMGYPSGVSNKILQYNEGNKTGVSVQLDKNNAISSITVNQIN